MRLVYKCGIYSSSRLLTTPCVKNGVLITNNFAFFWNISWICLVDSLFFFDEILTQGIPLTFYTSSSLDYYYGCEWIAQWQKRTGVAAKEKIKVVTHSLETLHCSVYVGTSEVLSLSRLSHSFVFNLRIGSTTIVISQSMIHATSVGDLSPYKPNVISLCN